MMRMKIKHWKKLILFIVSIIILIVLRSILLTDTFNLQKARLALNDVEDGKVCSYSVIASSKGTCVEIFEAVPGLYSSLCSHLNQVDEIRIFKGELNHADYRLINKQKVEFLNLQNCSICNSKMEYIDWSMLFKHDEKFLDSRFHCFTQLQGNTSIKTLRLDHCSVDEHVVCTIESMKNLNRLYITGNLKSKDFFQRLQKLSHLTCLHVCYMRISQRELNQIAQLKELEILDFGGSIIEGDLQSCIHNLKKLKQLCISSAEIRTELKLPWDNIEVIGDDSSSSNITSPSNANSNFSE